jgi:hypothetical protein
MKAIASTNELLTAARDREQAGEPETAAGLYRQILNQSPGNRDAVRRLLTIYRRLKDYRNEMAVIESVLSAASQKDKTVQGKWLAAHPGAAKLGKAVLKSLGGEQVTAYGTDRLVLQLLKRKEVVERKLSGKKPKKTPKKAKKDEEKIAKDKRRAEDRLQKQRVRDATTKEKAAKAADAAKAKADAAKAKADAATARSEAAKAKREVEAEKLRRAEAERLQTIFVVARVKDRAALQRILKQSRSTKDTLARIGIISFETSLSKGDLPSE